MPEIIELLTHYLFMLIKLLKPGGVKQVMAESIAMTCCHESCQEEITGVGRKRSIPFWLLSNVSRRTPSAEGCCDHKACNDSCLP